MKLRKNIRKILAIGGALAFAGAALVGCADISMTQSEYAKALKTEFERGEENIDIESDNVEVARKAREGVDITLDNKKAADDAIAGLTKEQVPDAIQQEILKSVTEHAAEAQAKIDEGDKDGYDLDKLEIGAEFSFIISDRQLSGLFDGEVPFDNEDYDAEEVIYLVDFVPANNYEDEYKADSYLQIPEDGVKYVMKFDSELNTLLIDEDDTLKFELLGDKVEVVGWDGDKVTFIKGTKADLEEGEFEDYENKTITLVMVGDDWVKVDVEGYSRKIYEGETERINGVEVRATEIAETESWRKGSATLEFGEDVFFEVEDGDEYEEDKRYKWAIDSKSIGIVLSEEFLSVDEDEEFRALAAGEKFSLPNDYVSLVYNGLPEEDTEKYSFEFDTKGGAEYVEVKGAFLKGLEDYSKVYINSSGIYDKDLELIDTTSIEFADAEIADNVPLTLDIDGDHLDMDDIELKLDLTELKVDGEVICSEDEDYLTTYGIVINSPEDACEDNEFEIVIPKEELEASMTFKTK